MQEGVYSVPAIHEPFMLGTFPYALTVGRFSPRSNLEMKLLHSGNNDKGLCISQVGSDCREKILIFISARQWPSPIGTVEWLLMQSPKKCWMLG